MKIISLIPSATDALYAMGLGENLVGVSHVCDAPASLPRLTRPHIDLEASSRVIHNEVTSLLENGLSPFHLDVNAIAGLAPDLVITQDACKVCAIDLDTLLDATQEVLGSDVQVVSLQPSTLAQVIESMITIGEAAGDRKKGEELATRMQEAIDDLALLVPSTERPRVAVLEWIEPTMLAGHWVPELIELAGGVALGPAPGDRSPVVDFLSILEMKPDILIVCPCGMDIITTYEQLSVLEEVPGFSDAPFSKNGRVYTVDGSVYLNRPGPTLVDSLGMLLTRFWPGLDAPSFWDEKAREMLMLETKKAGLPS